MKIILTKKILSHKKRFSDSGRYLPNSYDYDLYLYLIKTICNNVQIDQHNTNHDINSLLVEVI